VNKETVHQSEEGLYHGLTSTHKLLKWKGWIRRTSLWEKKYYLTPMLPKQICHHMATA